MLKTLAIALPLIAISSLAFAGTVPQVMCGKYPINAKHQCCYQNQTYNTGASVKMAGGVEWCHEGNSGDSIAHWSTSQQTNIVY